MHSYSVSLGMKRLKNPPLLINTQHTLPDHSMLPMEAEDTTYQGSLHPASYTCTVDCSLLGVLAKLKVRRLLMQITRSRDCACVLRNLEI